MGYGDLQFFDIIIFAAIALFLVFRLRKVLGKRTGFESNQKKNPKQSKNTLEEKDEDKHTPDLDDNLSPLKTAYMELEEFEHKNFLNGAKMAYETIINAFNKGDKETLKNLLTNETYLTFEEAINNKKNDPESQVFSLNIEKIEKVYVENNKIIISIKFVSKQFKNNDESTAIKKEDVWSFEKLVKSKSPNWLLSST